jgi:hypothetical protein
MLLWVSHYGAIFTIQWSSATGLMAAMVSVSGYFEKLA